MRKKGAGRPGKLIAPKNGNVLERIGARLPALIVLLSCLVFAVYVGALQPEFYFQRVDADNGGAGGSSDAYASGNALLFKLPHAKEMGVRANFSGSGHISSLSFAGTDQTANVTKITVDGKVACSPCAPGEEYPVDARGNVSVVVFAEETSPSAAPGNGFLKRVFFEKTVRTEIEAVVDAKLAGGWQSSPNSAVPSSFYGVDAPFHIHRVPIGASHLMLLQWPWAEYTYISAVPASLIYLLLGVSHQYAYKLWEILLFFLPVAVFYLFSRKLPRGKDAVFMFSSLIYLFLPSQGMLTGGGADLFMYGMTAHTFATSLSLVSLLFAYEFVVDGKNARFWPALLLFVLAVASNQRIFIALAIGMGALFALSLAVTGARRAVLLGIACAAAAAFLLAPFALNTGIIAAYSVLGGASTESLGWSLVGLFQLGYFILPLLFIAGVAAAITKRETFLLFLFAICALVFAFATSQGLNRLAPFLDGLRFMPSFFLPLFFVSGAGALYAFEFALGAVEKAGEMLKLDRLDAAVSFCLAILAPLAVLFASVALTTMDQYRDEAASLSVASEYSELHAAYGIIGDGCVFVQGRMEISQYPVYEEGLERSVIADADSSGGIIAAMANARCKYLLLGNAKTAASAAEKTRWQEYEGFKSEPRLAEVAYGGSNRLFVLRGAEAAAKVESASARVGGYSFDYDRGSVQGECLAENCTLRIRQDSLPSSLACSGAAGCEVKFDAATNAVYVSGIPQGKFSIALEPQAAHWLCPLALAGAIVALACGYAAGRMPGTSD
ncbi:MAG: hypothetical protein NTX79_02985 [Candidatus Micrarchaeota archaeon]|nr:hypothetical protein [Candidatus Micrarchaeota archaeon]